VVGGGTGPGSPGTSPGTANNPTTTTTIPNIGTTPQLGSVAALPAGQLDSGRVVLRRLNDREYDNTARDLLTTAQTLAASTFPADNLIDGFDTVGQGLTYSDLLFQKQFAASTSLVTELLARPATDPVRTAILSCEPTAATESTCLTQILTTFMPQAWRRPVTSTEIANAVAVATAVTASATSEAATTTTTTTTTGTAATDPVTTGVSAALQYVLDSPNYLYHVELGSPAITPTSTAVTPLSDYEVASRLSYFLWQSMPDATLTQLAAMTGQLSKGTAVPTQVTRMIADPKFSGFLSGFVGQWLILSNVNLVSPDPTMFPNVDQALINSIAPEANAFTSYLITQNRPLTELLTANYTFANGRLAQFYGLSSPPPSQTTFTQTSLAGTNRLGGLLTQEAFLTTTSLATRTSPVLRGNFVLAQILSSPPPAPPPNVPVLVTPDAGSNVSVRDALNEHASNPSCAGCHSLIDPIGFTFENFDATGAWRTVDNGVPIDNSGTLYGTGGAPVDGAQGIAGAIVADQRFVQSIVKQAMTYGIGRTFDLTDGLGYIETVASPLQKGGTWQSALQTVATSQAFLTTRGGQ
jgi:hypothetical protein